MRLDQIVIMVVVVCVGSAVAQVGCTKGCWTVSSYRDQQWRSSHVTTIENGAEKDSIILPLRFQSDDIADKSYWSAIAQPFHAHSRANFTIDVVPWFEEDDGSWLGSSPSAAVSIGFWMPHEQRFIGVYATCHAIVSTDRLNCTLNWQEKDRSKQANSTYALDAPQVDTDEDKRARDIAVARINVFHDGNEWRGSILDSNNDRIYEVVENEGFSTALLTEDTLEFVVMAHRNLDWTRKDENPPFGNAWGCCKNNGIGWGEYALNEGICSDCASSDSDEEEEGVRVFNLKQQVHESSLAPRFDTFCRNFPRPPIYSTREECYANPWRFWNPPRSNTSKIYKNRDGNNWDSVLSSGWRYSYTVPVWSEQHYMSLISRPGSNSISSIATPDSRPAYTYRNMKKPASNVDFSFSVTSRLFYLSQISVNVPQCVEAGIMFRSKGVAVGQASYGAAFLRYTNSDPCGDNGDIQESLHIAMVHSDTEGNRNVGTNQKSYNPLFWQDGVSGWQSEVTNFPVDNTGANNRFWESDDTTDSDEWCGINNEHLLNTEPVKFTLTVDAAKDTLTFAAQNMDTSGYSASITLDNTTILNIFTHNDEFEVGFFSTKCGGEANSRSGEIDIEWARAEYKYGSSAVQSLGLGSIEVPPTASTSMELGCGSTLTVCDAELKRNFPLTPLFSRSPSYDEYDFMFQPNLRQATDSYACGGAALCGP